MGWNGFNNTTSTAIISNPALIATCRANVARGQIIRYSHIVAIIDLYNSWTTHTHSFTQAIWRHEWGNAPPGTPAANESGAAGVSAVLVAAYPVIPAAANPGNTPMDEIYHNQATNLVANLTTLTHTHPVTDKYYYEWA